MSEYSWPEWGDRRDHAEALRRAWPETARALPAGTRTAAEVVGRQPFGVFLRFEGRPDAIGLAEVTAMPNCGCLELPSVGERVTGVVISHAEHHFQVRVRLDAWARHPDGWPEFADAVGRNVVGTVTRRVDVGVFVRVDDCVEGLIYVDDLPEPDAFAGHRLREGRQVPVRIAAVDLIHHRVRLALAEEDGR